MRYLLLIYEPERPPDAEIPPEVMKAEMDAWGAFTREVRARDVMRAGEALQPSSTATSVRIRDGRTLVTDGPFAETKETLGGFYLIDCRDLDEAIELSAKMPNVGRGTVEIRPIWELPQEYASAEGREAVTAH